MHSTSSLSPGTTIAIVGAGRLGGVLAPALRAVGFVVLGPLRRDDRVPDADVALLCVPDAAIPAVAFAVRPHVQLVGHVSGATPLTDVDFSIHPLQTFTGRETPEVFRGIGAAVDGRTPEALSVAEKLATALGAHPFRVDDGHRAEYHAAASFASNFVLTVLDAAERLAAPAGVQRAHLAPLVRQTVENWTASGAAAALTGPIVRGDDETVARQRAASAAFADLFDALAAATRDIAHPGTSSEERRA
ncbi:DUF2520 domain-containing protein [Microbacterium sp.]|uniref:DUF2520 domain-containing protein n=1 Tax=Microbacterium sp. TaxID=51671 RepID=UPI0028A2D8D4|nr:DUF2520 domain-containing protein [Microbacterium sp.]